MRARKRLVIGVHVAFVFPQVRRADEVFSALFTLVRLFPGVRSDVLAVIGRPDVAAVAKRATVRSFPRVQSLVLLERSLVRIRLAADVAHVGLESGVSRDVALQVAQLLERPVAVRTLERTLLRIDIAAFLHRFQKSRHFRVMSTFYIRRYFDSVLLGFFNLKIFEFVVFQQFFVYMIFGASITIVFTFKTFFFLAF